MSYQRAFREELQARRAALQAEIARVDAAITALDALEVPTVSVKRLSGTIAPAGTRIVRTTVTKDPGTLPDAIRAALKDGPKRPGDLIAATSTTRYLLTRYIETGQLTATGKTAGRLISLPGQTRTIAGTEYETVWDGAKGRQGASISSIGRTS